MPLGHVDPKSKLYFITLDHGHTCLGWDIAFKQAKAVAEWLGLPLPDPKLIGTERGYEEYQAFMAAGKAHHAETKQRCLVELDSRFTPFYERKERVEVVLKPGFEQYYGYGLRVDGKKQRFWVGRSTGWMPIYLQILNTKASGGEAISSSGIESVRGIGKFRR